MLSEADAGFLFHAPDNVRSQFPQFRALDAYGDLLPLMLAAAKA
jgi:phosphoserine/homoserine phosphotransferase